MLFEGNYGGVNDSYFVGEKVDPTDCFRTSLSNSKHGDGSLPYPLRIASTGKQHMILSDSKTNCRYDTISSENMDPSHDSVVATAPLMTSTVVSKPVPNQKSKTSVDNEAPPTSTAAPNRRNLLGATATNSPLTPRYNSRMLCCICSLFHHNVLSLLLLSM